MPSMSGVTIPPICTTTTPAVAGVSAASRRRASRQSVSGSTSANRACPPACITAAAEAAFEEQQLVRGNDGAQRVEHSVGHGHEHGGDDPVVLRDRELRDGPDMHAEEFTAGLLGEDADRLESDLTQRQVGELRRL